MTTEDALNQATDELNDAIDAVEAALGRKFVVQAEIPLGDGWVLGYGKQYGLYVAQENHSRIPLRTASRRMRVGGCMCLHPLVAALADVTATQLSDVKQATQHALELAARLSQ